MTAESPLNEPIFFHFEKEDSSIVKNDYWSSLSKLDTKYSWMFRVRECIRSFISRKLTLDSYRHLTHVMESFVDKQLMPINPEEFGETDFGTFIISKWLHLSFDDVKNNSSLNEFAGDIQDAVAFYSNSEDANLENLYVTVTSVVMVKYLGTVLEAMNKNSYSDDIITLFYCVYVERTDLRFKFLDNDKIVPNLIPIEPSTDGHTVEYLRMMLPDLLSRVYSQHATLEDGVLQLLAGSSNIITIDELTAELAEMHSFGRNFAGKSKLFILHDLILSSTYTNIQHRLRDSPSKFWSVALVLDCLNEAACSYHELLQTTVS